jgi:hypothetical protein
VSTTGDDPLKRYRAGLPARDEAESAAYREWAELDAEVIEDFLLPDQAFETYSGPLSYEDFVADYRRASALERDGIERQRLPDRYASALGHMRSERLAWQVEDQLLTFAWSHPSHKDLSAQARQLAAAGRALNEELSTRVTSLESSRDDLVEQREKAQREDIYVPDLDPEDPDLESLRVLAAEQEVANQQRLEQLKGVLQELELLSEHHDHPDRWIDQNGGKFKDALAAQYWFHNERELAEDPDRARHETPAPEPVREVGDTGYAF